MSGPSPWAGRTSSWVGRGRVVIAVRGSGGPSVAVPRAFPLPWPARVPRPPGRAAWRGSRRAAQGMDGNGNLLVGAAGRTLHPAALRTARFPTKGSGAMHQQSRQCRNARRRGRSLPEKPALAKARVAGSYRPGLFHCYQVADLPRTNNDLEQSFGSSRYHERRATGRKTASPGTVVRGSVRLIAGAGTWLAPPTAHDLARVDRVRWQGIRKSLDRPAPHPHGSKAAFAATPTLTSPTWNAKPDSSLCAVEFFAPDVGTTNGSTARWRPAQRRSRGRGPPPIRGGPRFAVKYAVQPPAFGKRWSRLVSSLQGSRLCRARRPGTLRMVKAAGSSDGTSSSQSSGVETGAPRRERVE